MRDVNKIILLGRLGKDPFMRETKNGKAVASFSLATSRKYRSEENEGNLVEETQWHKVAAFGKQAENCGKYLRKGDLVYIEGTLRSSSYGAKDGTTRTGFDVHVEEISFLSKVGGSGREDGPGTEDVPVANAS